jgi:multisubunit Na+/H+ antiporter MnhF subunit
MTQLPQERAKLASARTLGAAGAIILLSVVVSSQITRSENLQRSLTVTTLILAVVGIALYLVSFRTSREIVERDAAPVSLKQSLGAIRHNRPLVLLCLSAVFMLTGMFTRARTTAERLVALDTAVLMLIGLLGLVAAESRRPYALDAALVLALLSFVSTVAASRYLGDRRPFTEPEEEPSP